MRASSALSTLGRLAVARLGSREAGREMLEKPLSGTLRSSLFWGRIPGAFYCVRVHEHSPTSSLPFYPPDGLSTAPSRPRAS